MTNHLLGILCPVMLLGFGLSSGPPQLPDRPPDVNGVITDLRLPHDGAGRPGGTPKESAPRGTVPAAVLVEAVASPHSRSYRIWLTFHQSSRIFRVSGSEMVEGEFQDLKIDQKVSVWLSGPVLLSDPAQGHAEAVLIRRSLSEVNSEPSSR